MSLDGSLIAHGSALILPLAVIEGPLVSIAAGFLSEQGYFDWLWALGLLVCGDLIGDLIYYWIGRTGKTGLTRLLRRFGIHSTVTPDFERHLKNNATKMLFIGKWTQSVGVVVLVGSGMLRVPLAKFLTINLLATVPKSVVLFSVGYFAGDRFHDFGEHPILSGIALGAIGIAATLFVLRKTDIIRAGGTSR